MLVGRSESLSKWDSERAGERRAFGPDTETAAWLLPDREDALVWRRELGRWLERELGREFERAFEREVERE